MIDVSDLVERVTKIAPLPLTVAEPQAGRAVIVGSNGRVLGWVATDNGDWRAVAELWANAPTIIVMLAQHIQALEG